MEYEEPVVTIYLPHKERQVVQNSLNVFRSRLLAATYLKEPTTPPSAEGEK